MGLGTFRAKIRVATKATKKICVLRHSVVSDSFMTPQTVAHQSPLPMRFSRQEFWSGSQFPTPGGSSQPRERTHISCVFCIGRDILVLLRKPVKTWSVQFSLSVVSDFCGPMNHSTPGLPVHHYLPEFTQTQVHRVSDAIQPSHPLSPPFSAPNTSQHQSIFQ